MTSKGLPENTAEFAILRPVDVSAYGVADIANFTADDLSAMSTFALRAFSSDQIQALTAATITGLSTSIIPILKPAEIAALTATQICELSVVQLANITKVQFASLSPDQIAAFAPSQIFGLGRGKISTMTAAQASGLTALEIIGLTKNERAALSADDVAALSADTINSLSANAFAGLQGFTATQIAQFSSATIGKLTVSQFDTWIVPNLGQLSPIMISRLPTADLQSLASDAIGALSGADIAAMTPAQLNALFPAEVAAFSSTQIASLTPDQLNAVDAPFLAALNFSHLTSSQVAALAPSTLGSTTAANLSALTSTEISSLTPEQIAGLTGSELNAVGEALFASPSSGLNPAYLTAIQIGALQPFLLDELTPAEVAAFTPTQMAGLTGYQLNALGEPFLAQLDPAYLTESQIGALDDVVVASLSALEFDKILGSNLASLSTEAVQGVSVVDLQSLTAKQLAEFTTDQKSVMTQAQLACFQTIDPIVADAQAHEVDGALGYSGMLSVLQDAAVGGMTDAKFAGLKAVASEIDSGAITAPAYLDQLFDNVVLGNAANALWHGGAVTGTTLGNLSATSTNTQVDELIGKWFLGTDLPGMETDPSGGAPNATYQVSNLPLFGSTGAPALNDASQGQLDDGAFLATLAETALQDPSQIEQMITNNGNGTYTVQFQNNTMPDYVTVNSEFPTFTDGELQGNGSGLAFASSTSALWAPLIEKAYAQLSEQPGVTAGGEYQLQQNQYLALAGGDDEAISLVTGGFTLPEYLGVDSSSVAAIFSQAAQSFAAGDDILVGTGAAIGSLAADDVYAVTGIDTASGMISLFNPLGANSAAHGTSATLQVSESTLSASGAWLYVATGAPAALT